ncbi:MAG: hypothetical protein ACLSCX_01535 [Oscillospiraceae bacterium]
MTMIAEVAVSCAIFAIDQPYSYRIPQGMQILPGMRVVVPFGRANRRTEAIVLGVQTGSEDKLKAIEQLLDDAPVMTDEQLRLAAFVRERYFCTYYDAVKAILPAGLWFRQENLPHPRFASDCGSLPGRRRNVAGCWRIWRSARKGAFSMEDRQQRRRQFLAAFQKTHENDLELTQKPGRKRNSRDCRPKEAARYAKAHRTRAGGGRAARCGGRIPAECRLTGACFLRGWKSWG